MKTLRQKKVSIIILPILIALALSFWFGVITSRLKSQSDDLREEVKILTIQLNTQKTLRDVAETKMSLMRSADTIERLTKLTLLVGRFKEKSAHGGPKILKKGKPQPSLLSEPLTVEDQLRSLAHHDQQNKQ